MKLMAHWAQVDGGGVVIQVTVGSDDDHDEGYQWLIDNLGGMWVKTSFSSRGGRRVDPDTGEPIEGTHFRYNYAGIGWKFDPTFGEDGAFIPPQPHPSWVLNPETALWEPPIPMPLEGGPYYWDEESGDWIARTLIADEDA